MKLTPFSLTLKDGGSVLIREVSPKDRHLLEAGFKHLSDRSRFFRFLAPHPDLPNEELDRFAALNNEDHVAIGALSERETPAEPAAIARYARLTDRGNVAEFAVTVIDNHQGRGMGSVLLATLAKFSVENGISEFVGLVHNENKPMLGLLDQLGGVRHLLGGSELEIRFPLYKDPERYPRSRVGDTFRKIYALAKIA